MKQFFGIAFAAVAAIAALAIAGVPAARAQQSSAYIQGTLTPGDAVQACGQYCLQDAGGVIPAGHLTTTGTAPTVGSGSSDCGTSPAIVGNDNNGRVTVGSSTNGSKCTITFAATWAHAPQCQVQDEVTANLMRPAPSTTALVINGTLAAGDTIAYECRDYR